MTASKSRLRTATSQKRITAAIRRARRSRDKMVHRGNGSTHPSVLFAASIFRRYGTQVLFLTPLQMSLHRRREGITLTRALHQHHLHLSPQLRLTLAFFQPNHGGRPLSSHIELVTQLQRESDVSVKTIEQRSEHEITYWHPLGIDDPQPTGTLVARLAGRSERIETVGARSRGAPMQGAEPAVMPSSLVVRRAAAVAAIESHESGQSRLLQFAAQDFGSRATSRHQNPAEPALDINRLTDQIVQVIDRRIIAHRERTGRA